MDSPAKTRNLTSRNSEGIRQQEYLHSHSDGSHHHDHSHTDPSHSHTHSHDDNKSTSKESSTNQTEPDLTSPAVREKYNIPPMMDSEEASYLIRTILSFKYYKKHEFAMNHRRMKSFYALPETQRALLQPEFTKKLEAIDGAIEKNALIANTIAMLGEEMYLGGHEVPMGGPITPKEKDMEKAKSTLKQFVRDWSVEGREERDLCYGPVLKALDTLYGHLTMEQKAEIRVLIPGAGLGRIVYDVLRAGYEVQGNELEFCMLMASNLALNMLDPERAYELYPYIHTMSHHRSTQDVVRCVSIPDTSAGKGMRLSGTKAEMSMVAGDFIDCYSSPSDAGTFSVVITIFFIDTAPNVLQYLETIYNVLEPNGVWINIGPLAWHFEPDSESTPPRTGGTIELTLEELLSATQKIGFVLETGENLTQKSISMPYMGNNRGLLTYLYHTEFWVARKT